MQSILPGLFDARVVTEEVEPFSAVLSELSPREAEGVRGVLERILEFRAGRHCAKVALARLGKCDAEILRSPDRAPIWPPGFVGSITHTRSKAWGFCGAAVARDTDVRGVGLDAELDVPLEDRLFPKILTADEYASVSRMPDERRGWIAKVVFSAKESVYKCQHPLSGQFLGFSDVDVEVFEASGRFRATLRRSAGPFQEGVVFEGRFVRKSGVLATAVTLFH